MESVEGKINDNGDVVLQINESQTQAGYAVSKQYRIPIGGIENLPWLPGEKPAGYCHSVLFWIPAKEIWVGFNNLVPVIPATATTGLIKKGDIYCESREGQFEGPYLIRDFPRISTSEVDKTSTSDKLLRIKDDLYFLRIVEEKYPFLVQLVRSAGINELRFYSDSSQVYSQRPMNIKDERMTCGGTENWRLYVIRENVLEGVNMQIGRREIYPPRNWLTDDPPGDVYQAGESVAEALRRIDSEGIKYVVLHGQCRRSEETGEPLKIFNKIMICRFENSVL